MNRGFKILSLVFWRPLPLFIAGAVISTTIAMKGPSNVSLLLIAPGLAALHMLSTTQSDGNDFKRCERPN